MNYKKKCKVLKKKLKKAKRRLLFAEASLDLLKQYVCNEDDADPKKPKGVFIGKIVSVVGDVVVQKIGRKVSETKEHSLKSLDVEPKVGQLVSIAYDNMGNGVVETQ